MTNIWDRTPATLNISEAACFQALTWKSYDLDDEFCITCCGCLENGKSVALTITDFKPSFFVKIPTKTSATWSSRYTEAFKNTILKKLGRKYSQLSNVKTVKAKTLYPFTNQTKFLFLKLEFNTLAAFKTASYFFKHPIKNPDASIINGFYEPYETNIDPMLRFCHSKNVNMAGWLKIDAFHNTPHISNCAFNISAKFNNITPINDKQATAPFVLASFDIECDSKATRDRHRNKYEVHADTDSKRKLTTIFPDAKKDGDEIKIICTSLWKYGTEHYLKHAVCVSPWGEVPDTGADICHCVNNEKELLISWFGFMKKYDPDVMMGWNIYGFDDEYIFNRLERNNLSYLMEDCGRLKEINGSMKDSKLVTSAYGTNFFRIMDFPGIYKVDLYVWFKKETKLESYKLDRVSEKFLGENKVDLIPLDLFFKMNIDATTMSECVKYCVQDTLLPLRLTKARMIFINLIGMANITRVPIEWLITRGQQIKVFSQITYETRLANILVPTWDKKTDSDEKFLGATVLHANKGAYFEAVSGLDFASLYPSIMIAFNLCYSTMVLPEDVHKYSADPNIELENIKWQQHDENTNESVEQSYWYVQNIQGVLPRILDKLWKQRKAVKKLMKQAARDNDETLEGIYNAEQLAIKVSMNSVYGFTGATNGFLPMKPIASSVTAKGRHLIEITKNHCEQNFECDVVYGDTDSCYVKFVARNKDTNAIINPEEPGYMEEIFRLSELATVSCNTHLYKKPIDLEFEKVMYPFFLFTKKRYAYLEWTNTDKPNHLEAKGIHLVRRDVCPYVQEISKTVLNTMFYERNVKKAVEQAELAVGDLITNRVPVSKLKLSKTLKVGYKCSKCHTAENDHGLCICPSKIPTINLPHVQLAKRLKEQNSIDPPQPGERVPYVFIEGVGLQHERVEHPDLINASTKPDGMYYLEHQLRVPLQTLFELVLTPENGWPNGTSTLFEKGHYSETIALLKTNAKEREQRHKFQQRLNYTAKFTIGTKVKRKINSTESIHGIVTNVDYENGRIAVSLENNKNCNIFPDSLSIIS